MEANILVDGYFAGEPIEVDPFPPPAAISRARLVVPEPSKEDAALNVDYKISKSSNHVTLTFSAQPKSRFVLESGEVIWRNDRAYYGRWYKYWESCNR